MTSFGGTRLPRNCISATYYSVGQCKHIKLHFSGRCLETSRLFNLGKVAELAALNSFFENPDREPIQTKALLEWVRSASLKKPTVLVSHQVNIAALTEVSPESGEIIFVHRLVDGSLSVIGSIQTLE